MRSFVLTEAERKKVREYLENLPERMPGRIKRMRSRLFRTDLEEMRSDIELLDALKAIEVPIGRIRSEGRGEAWSDQRGKFSVRPRTESGGMRYAGRFEISYRKLNGNIGGIGG